MDERITADKVKPLSNTLSDEQLALLAEVKRSLVKNAPVAKGFNFGIEGKVQD